MDVSLAKMEGRTRACKEDKDVFICGRDEQKQTRVERKVGFLIHLIPINKI